MTRINVVPVQELTDKHLVAEYRELPRTFRLAEKYWLSPNTTKPLPNEYVLGTGHIKFFYDKLGFIKERFNALVNEMDRRDFKARYRSIPECQAPTLAWKGYLPTEKALKLNRGRITDRLTGK